MGSEQASNQGDDDQIGFVLCLDHEQTIGITILNCQFLYFNYASGTAKKRELIPCTESGHALDKVPSQVMQVIEVQNKDSRTVTYVVTATESYLDIFALDISGRIPTIVHMKNLKISANSICSSVEEPNTFFISTRNQVAVVTIDPSIEKKVRMAD